MIEDEDVERKVKCMTKQQHIALFQQVFNNGIPYSQNRNGIFISYTNLNEEQKQIIIDFIKK